MLSVISLDTRLDAFYDRGSTFPLKCYLNANLVLNNDAILHLGNEIIHRDAF